MDTHAPEGTPGRLTLATKEQLYGYAAPERALGIAAVRFVPILPDGSFGEARCYTALAVISFEPGSEQDVQLLARQQMPLLHGVGEEACVLRGLHTLEHRLQRAGCWGAEEHCRLQLRGGQVVVARPAGADPTRTQAIFRAIAHHLGVGVEDVYPALWHAASQLGQPAPAPASSFAPAPAPAPAPDAERQVGVQP